MHSDAYTTLTPWRPDPAGNNGVEDKRLDDKLKNSSGGFATK